MNSEHMRHTAQTIKNGVLSPRVRCFLRMDRGWTHEWFEPKCRSASVSSVSKDCRRDGSVGDRHYQPTLKDVIRGQRIVSQCPSRATELFQVVL